MTVVAELVPTPGPAHDLDGVALRDWLADRYLLPGDRWLRLNLVTGLGGQITGPSGTSEDLTGGIDRALMGVIRTTADAVLVGAGSARVERYTLPRQALLAVATMSGRLAPGDLPAPQDGRSALVLCPEGHAAALAETLRDRATIVALPDMVRHRAGLLHDALAARGLPRVLCEGGGALATALLADGAVDEFDQTIAPVAVSPGAPLLTGSLAPTAAVLDGLLRDGTDRLYARWRFPR